jgi:ABC-type transport system substrate-binding protein
MAKSFYEGLFGFDKDMKMIPVLAESYERRRTASSTRSS